MAMWGEFPLPTTLRHGWKKEKVRSFALLRMSPCLFNWHEVLSATRTHQLDNHRKRVATGSTHTFISKHSHASHGTKGSVEFVTVLSMARFGHAPLAPLGSLKSRCDGLVCPLPLPPNLLKSHLPPPPTPRCLYMKCHSSGNL